MCSENLDELLHVTHHLQAGGCSGLIYQLYFDERFLDGDQAVDFDGVEVIEDSALTPLQLNEIDAVVTACAVGVAETGTIVLDHADDQGRRALSLVPDIHVCVVAADQVVSDVPEAITRLGDAATSRRPMTFISGPSATSDIELSRVEGVHGPRTLHVIVTE